MKIPYIFLVYLLTPICIMALTEQNQSTEINSLSCKNDEKYSEIIEDPFISAEETDIKSLLLACYESKTDEGNSNNGEELTAIRQECYTRSLDFLFQRGINFILECPLLDQGLYAYYDINLKYRKLTYRLVQPYANRRWETIGSKRFNFKYKNQTIDDFERDGMIFIPPDQYGEERINLKSNKLCMKSPVDKNWRIYNCDFKYNQ